MKNQNTWFNIIKKINLIIFQTIYFIDIYVYI